MANAFIYALKCPDSGEIRYIGKANNPEKRLKSHIRDSVRGRRPVHAWVRSLVNAGSIPVMDVLREVSDWETEEAKEIASHRLGGARLLNIAKGGVDIPRLTGLAQRVSISGREASRAYAAKRKVGRAYHALIAGGNLGAAARFRFKVNVAAKAYPSKFNGWAL